MDVRQLRHFVAVADTLHFGKAAERLCMTQPPLSQSILALERELGASLFARTKRRVALTTLGAHWLPEVEAALARLDALKGLAQSLRDGRSGRLALSFVSIADYNVLPELVREFSARWPLVDLDLQEATSDTSIPALLDGKVNVGIIIPSATPLPAALDYMPLLTEPLVAAVPATWLSDNRVELTGGKLAAQSACHLPLILFPRQLAPAFHDLITRYVLRQDPGSQVVQQAIQMQTIISLVSAGVGIALVPASLRNMARSGVRYVDLQDAPMLETGIAWRRDDESPALRHLLTIARKTAPPDALDSLTPSQDADQA
ncbi:MAG: LysR family transcriptional regulator [Sphingobium sp.]|uniref:LysR family transcriptional regulator n=1 Tax=Sphingobium sp. TaxID=1912891 RepID=UPI0029A220C2|nr:LysR family transcriptional regulator [Sphingobium sp.]MDX3911516.1 LysR family transcriptional regulator [Sphingobium sp.]